ncbi:MAG: HEAT repeat domain-containing protein [Bacteroidetes bacterium]|nr:HEAT repeat domain-containing protein [Bacteroidota bacterium]
MDTIISVAMNKYQESDNWQAPETEPSQEELLRNIPDLELAKTKDINDMCRDLQSEVPYKWYVYHEGYVYYIPQHRKLKELKRARCDGKEIKTLYFDCAGYKNMTEVSDGYVYFKYYSQSSDREWDMTEIWSVSRIKIDGSGGLVQHSLVEVYSDPGKTDRTSEYFEDDDPRNAWTVRETEARNSTCQEYLKGVASADDHYNVRLSAVRNITDVEFLKNVALTDDNWKVRLTALRNISDEDFLGKIVMNDKEQLLCEEVLEKITSEAVLKNIILKMEHVIVEPHIHMTALERKILTTALAKIADEDFLKKIARTYQKSYLRLEAVKRIANEDFLKMIVKTEQLWGIRAAAIEKITDQNFLKKIIKTEKEKEIRYRAVKNITDQDFLKAIAKDKDSDVRYHAVAKITDENFLKKIIATDDAWTVRKKAIENITDQDCLKKIALYDRYYGLDEQAAAVANINDIDFLKETVKKYYGRIHIVGDTARKKLASMQEDADRELRDKRTV